MSRFGEGDGEEFPGQYDLWRANAKRAINGRRGQEALQDLESALLALPAKRLIAGHLAHRGEVCAIGALVAHRRVAKGEDRDVVLADLAARAPAMCECGHAEPDHVDLVGHCAGCDAARDRGRERFAEAGREPDEEVLSRWYSCEAFVDSGESDDYGDVTVQAGRAVGLSYVLAWEIAWANDEQYSSLTPEQRYQRTIQWVREKLGRCTCGGRHTNVDGNGGHAVNCPVRTGITAVAA